MKYTIFAQSFRNDLTLWLVLGILLHTFIPFLINSIKDGVMVGFITMQIINIECQLIHIILYIFMISDSILSLSFLEGDLFQSNRRPNITDLPSALLFIMIIMPAFILFIYGQH